MQNYSANTIKANPDAVVMYVDMNCYFASCEQQLRPELRGRPIGIIAGDKGYSVIIAPSREAKVWGVKTGMRLNEARLICPQIIGVAARPVEYRKFHIAIIAVLHKYCSDVIPKSIDEAAMNLTSYRLVYKDMKELALQIKADLKADVGEYVTCSIGIAPNTFLAKLASDFQKPDGLVQITADNLDEYLAQLTLEDLPGIAKNNSRRLELVGIKTPLQMRHTSQSLLRKAFGGVVGYYWHCRLNFGEVDLYTSDYRTMSATRMVSPEQRGCYEKLDALLISLCTKLEQRLVKSGVFCRQLSFFIRYKDLTAWDMQMRFNDPVQDAMEMRRYIMQRMQAFELSHQCGSILRNNTRQMGVTVMDFVRERDIQYTLFDNRLKQDHLRKVMYGIKDKWGKYTVRKATELVQHSKMQDAIGFGSIKDLYEAGGSLNKYMLEETEE
jgi:DNA polymerase-4